MSSAQSVILPFGQPPAFPGQVTRRIDSDSAVSKESSANIGFGLGVKPGTNVKEMLLPTASNSALLGITINNAVSAPGGSGGFGGLDQVSAVDGITPNGMAEVLTNGRIWAQVDADASPAKETSAYWRWQSDGVNNTRVGTFRETDDGHVVDTRKQVKFNGGKFKSVDQLTGGSTWIAEVMIDVYSQA